MAVGFSPILYCWNPVESQQSFCPSHLNILTISPLVRWTLRRLRCVQDFLPKLSRDDFGERWFLACTRYTVKYSTRPYSRFVCISLTVDFLRRVRLPIPPSSTLPSCPWSRIHLSRFPPTFCFIAMQFQHSYTSSTKSGIVLTHALLVLSATEVRAKKNTLSRIELAPG